MTILDTLDTLMKFWHVFACPDFLHIQFGFMLHKTADGYVCHYCGRPVTDATKTPAGNYYLQAGRADLWRQR